MAISTSKRTSPPQTTHQYSSLKNKTINEKKKQKKTSHNMDCAHPNPMFES